MSGKAVKPKSSAELRDMRLLRDHEKAIEAGLRSFIDIGRHLGIIARDKLHKAAGFDRFEDYVEARLDISRQHAYRIIDAARVALTVSPNGDKITSEAVARELVPLSSDQEKLREVFEEADRRAAGRRITAALVREVREELVPGVPTIDSTVVDEAPALAAQQYSKTAAGGSNVPPADGGEGLTSPVDPPAAGGPGADGPAGGNPLTAAEGLSSLSTSADGAEGSRAPEDAPAAAAGASVPASAVTPDPPADSEDKPSTSEVALVASQPGFQDHPRPHVGEVAEPTPVAPGAAAPEIPSSDELEEVEVPPALASSGDPTSDWMRAWRALVLDASTVRWHITDEELGEVRDDLITLGRIFRPA